MQELIALNMVEFDGTEQQTVNARDLHAFLEVGKDFSTWIKDRISQFDFAEGVDFVKTQDLSSPNLGSAKSRAQTKIEYHLSLGMAKELAMVERTEKGKQARLYFIECEKIAKQKAVNPALPNYTNLTKLQILEMALESEQQRLALENRLEEAQPTIAFTKQVEISQGAITVAQAAKILNTGRTRMFAFLRSIGWVTRKNEPYQDKITAGLLDVKLGSWEHPEHGIQQSVTTLVTGKGLTKLQALWAARLQGTL